jgi:hypothetical protein
LYFTHRTKRKKGEAMKRLIIVICILLFASLSYAAVGVRDEGGTTFQATDIDFVGTGVSASGSGSVATITIAGDGQGIVEESDTPDTVATSESGTTFIATSSAQGGKTFDLPSITSSDDGTWYKFLMGGPTTDSDDESIDLIIHQQDDSAIFLNSKGADGATIVADVTDASDSYPTVELVAFDGDWYVVNLTGTWAAN